MLTTSFRPEHPHNCKTLRRMAWFPACPSLQQRHTYFILQMIRSRGLFQHSMYPIVVLHFSENGAELELKRNQWVEHESWKRCVLYYSSSEILLGSS